MTTEQATAPHVFGLTGGMGSGKSTVAAAFAERNAILLDADQIVRDLQAPNQPILLGMVAILGEEIISDSGELDRAAAAKNMFSDPTLQQAVQELIHPLVWSEIRTNIDAAYPEDIVILDVPLLLETRPPNLHTQGILVVDTEVELAVKRLVQYRGFTEEEAQARIAKQMPREERVAQADHVISNNGSREDLLQATEIAWSWIKASQ